MTILALYDQHIRSLSAEEQLDLVALIARRMAHAVPAPVTGTTGKGAPARSLLELEGLGADLWQGMDAQEYVDQLRDEWDGRP